MPVARWNQPYAPDLMGGGGYYEMAVKIVCPATLAAAAPIFALQWKPVATTGKVYRFQLKWLKLHAIATTGLTAAQIVDFYAYKAKAYPTAYGGGTQKLPATLDQKRQGKYQDSQFIAGGDIRYYSSAFTGGAGISLEAIPFLGVSMWGTIAAGASLNQPAIEEFDEHHVPMTLDTGQGIVIQNGTLLPAAGAVTVWLDLGWMEEAYGSQVY